MSGESFVPVCHEGVLFAQGIPFYPKPWLIDNDERGESLVRMLGDSHAVLLKGHGSVAVSICLEAVFQVALNLEKNARIQCELMNMRKLNPFSPEDISLSPKREISFRTKWKVWNHFEELGEKNGLFE
ncbi:class II aldolase/adducin family protein [Thermodesulfobacteriota bacterium]